MFQPILQSFANGGFIFSSTFIDVSSGKFEIELKEEKKSNSYFLKLNLDARLDNGRYAGGPSCGSEQWLFLNNNLWPYVKGTCQNGIDFFTFNIEFA